MFRPCLQTPLHQKKKKKKKKKINKSISLTFGGPNKNLDI
jgi:hypothetical protein